MIETLYLILAITQVFILFFMFGPDAMRITTYLMVKKNPKWVAAHPEFTTHKWFERLSVWFHYIVGAASGLAIIYFSVINPNPAYYMQLLLMPIQILAYGFVGILILQYFWLARSIPNPEVIKASLNDRRISSYLPMWIYVFANIFCLSAILFHGYAYFSGWMLEEYTMSRIYAPFITLFIANLAVFFFLRRKYSESDFMFGSKGRRFEIGTMVAAILLLGISQLSRVYVAVYDLAFINDSVVMIGLAVFVQAITFYFYLHPKSKDILKEYKKFLAH